MQRLTRFAVPKMEGCRQIVFTLAANFFLSLSHVLRLFRHR